jgi:hypothetical protein
MIRFIAVPLQVSTLPEYAPEAFGLDIGRFRDRRLSPDGLIAPVWANLEYPVECAQADDAAPGSGRLRVRIASTQFRKVPCYSSVEQIGAKSAIRHLRDSNSFTMADGGPDPEGSSKNSCPIPGTERYLFCSREA